MQDRFKFRAYNFLSKKYTYFDEPEVQFAERNSVYLCGLIMPLLDEKQSLYFGKYELQQCTGLKDKHGKLIYEGDIVKTITHNLYEEHIGVIRYHTCYFSLDYKEVGKFGECGISLTKNTSDFVALEMLGNIYENPELIGGAK